MKMGRLVVAGGVAARDLLNQCGWMRSKRMIVSPLLPDRRNPRDFYLFYFACSHGAQASVRVPSKYPGYT